MSKPARSPGLIQRWFARPEPTADDAADYGTCYGLDLSLAPPPAPAPAVDATRTRAGWARRFRLRSRVSP
jgi:hypothetical protein